MLPFVLREELTWGGVMCRLEACVWLIVGSEKGEGVVVVGMAVDVGDAMHMGDPVW
jgi:hypothetical protein